MLAVLHHRDRELEAAAAMRTAVIWLSVSVPVLSEQITLVQPSVSTLASRLMIAF